MTPSCTSFRSVFALYGHLGFLVGGEEAEKAFRRAAELFGELSAESPNSRYHLSFHADTWRALGSTLEALKRPEEAEQVYRKAVELHERISPPLDPGGFFSTVAVLGRFLAEHGRGPEAEKLLTRAEELYEKTPELKNSTDPWLHNNLAWTLVRDGRLPPRVSAVALQQAKRAVELAPRNSSIQNTLGTAYYRTGDWQAAIENLKYADELDGAGHFSINALCIAMAHWQLGEKEVPESGTRRRWSGCKSTCRRTKT